MLRPKNLIGIGLTFTVGITLAAWGILGSSNTVEGQVPEPPKTVAVVKVERADLARTVQLTAELRAWQEIDVHAKVAGYLKTISVDIGDQVKKGQVIATLDLPEEKQDQAKAEADYNVAQLNFNRIEAVIKKQPGLLAQEEVDKARAVYEEAKAVYERTKILSDYAAITMPFAGVITKRFADPGALVQAGTASNTQAMPLVHLAEMDKLRLDFPVPESIVSQIKVGMPVDLTVQNTGETVHSSIARMSDEINSSTRTMDVEIDIGNGDLHLKPGMYANATVTLEAKQKALAVPLQAVAMGDKPKVWVVDAQNKVEERPVTLGLQTPDKIEIVSGVSEGDRLIYGNHGNIGNGVFVAPKLINATGE